MRESLETLNGHEFLVVVKEPPQIRGKKMDYSRNAILTIVVICGKSEIH